MGDITLAGAQKLRTICVEGESIDAVGDTVVKAGLRLGEAVLGYVDLLQAAPLWLPEVREATKVAG